MIAEYVPGLLTPLTKVEAAKALADGFTDLMGRKPEPRTLAILMAQTALETARWKKIYCYNWGNIKASERWPGLYTCFRCNEVEGRVVSWFDPDTDGFAVPPGHPQTRFRAYASAADGAEDYLRFLAVDSNGDGVNRYERAWQAAMRGNETAFCGELKKAGYFTAPLGPYLRGVSLMVQEFACWLHNVEAKMKPAEVEEIDVCLALACRLDLAGPATEAAQAARDKLIGQQTDGGRFG